MKQLQPYLSLLYNLLLSMTLLAYRVVRQIVLPGRKRSGNLLSSLFLLYDGLTEEAITVRRAFLRISLNYAWRIPEKDRLQAAWSYSKKYLRRGMLVAGWILFILSLFEWSPSDRSARGPAGPQPIAKVITNASGKQAATAIATRSGSATADLIQQTYDAPTSYHPPQPPASKRWLLLRTLRI